MPRRTIDLEFKGLMTPRERVWQAVLTVPFLTAPDHAFDPHDVQARCKPMVRLSLVEQYLCALEAGGYVKRVGGGKRMGRGSALTPIRYQTVKTPADAPRLTKDGKPVTQGMATTAMWRAMKVLKMFDFHGVASAATLGDCVVSTASAKQYVKHLASAGYLAQVRPGKPGTATLWRLVKNTGPHAPAITRLKTVFDRNTGTFAALQSPQEVCDALEA